MQPIKKAYHYQLHISLKLFQYTNFSGIYLTRITDKTHPGGAQKLYKNATKICSHISYFYTRLLFHILFFVSVSGKIRVQFLWEYYFRYIVYDLTH
jgi:hypothetical protein